MKAAALATEPRSDEHWWTWYDAVYSSYCQFTYWRMFLWEFNDYFEARKIRGDPENCGRFTVQVGPVSKTYKTQRNLPVRIDVIDYLRHFYRAYYDPTYQYGHLPFDDVTFSQRHTGWKPLCAGRHEPGGKVLREPEE